ncbi:four helix bundle protein [Marinirhabdus gelatinilytica]|uniref:Four helix bundle protein n=1 Tax=Marinirhabdus gelatinilytica TaxID=1703343 RepID=A0A370QJ75_9FLAO|nr:four helix bundle protein [Marinirhabdus gelatinilytica]RDK88389.1 four helix bundle protein [Marinirhabdus gelatinilytica]
MKEVKFNFEELHVYQKALDYIDSIYETTNHFPKDERFRLTSQYIRAAISIGLNIAEGVGDTDAQFNRYIQIAQDSIKECVVCSTISRRQNFITTQQDNQA